MNTTPHPPLVDSHHRTVSYLRLSVTDRCDLRCTYCMSETMTFLPRKELLNFDELDRLCHHFIQRGVRHIRLTGGEPLVRKDLLDFISGLSRFIQSGQLAELTLTTNATQLEHHAEALYAAGVRRLNVSLDTLDPEKFRTITRRDRLAHVMRGIDAAQKAGLKIKINTVALQQSNFAELPDMVRWAHGRNMDMTIIETMPLGDVDEDRLDQYVPLFEVKRLLAETMQFESSDYRTSGPSRYERVIETGGRLGFITPLSHNFCESCNRVRVTCTGQLYTCLGHDGMIDLRAPLRENTSPEALDAAINKALLLKPAGHDFDISRRNQAPAVSRHMSVTGG